ncbi:hypothetical protein [Nostoc sp. 'Peltigera membranacea cyanobiont' 210A]|uniref:hypothetical protein n=1 Tax=Nostoc sp. 'Peltigera membranacea cyanobiont' 210A TaxID=2014529 RepID=UPI00167CA15A|nr:hypothetical protein [Nostoc sp. 'Peltigera membranacea cyanobiont' 210A]
MNFGGSINCDAYLDKYFIYWQLIPYKWGMGNGAWGIGNGEDDGDEEEAGEMRRQGGQ